VEIEFAILRDGNVAKMKTSSSSGDVELDRAAWGGIMSGAPFAPLPEGFMGQDIGLRFTFCYNPG
jgi:TonB family protein